MPVHPRDEAHGDDGLEDAGQLEPDLALVVRGENGDDAVDALGRVERVERAQDEMPGLGGQEGRVDRVQVAHLADQDDIGILAEAAAQTAGEAHDVHADLPLADGALLVLVEVLDGVLDGDDVLPPEGVDVVDHGREAGRLAASRRPRHEDEASLVEGDLLQDLREEQLADGLDLEGDDAQGDGQRTPLVVDAAAEAPEPGQAVGQVDVEVLGQPLPLEIGHQLGGELLAVDGRQPGIRGQGRERPVDADHGIVAGLEVKVRGVPFNRDLQEFIDDHEFLLECGVR